MCEPSHSCTCVCVCVCVWWGQGRKFPRAMEEHRSLHLVGFRKRETSIVGMWEPTGGVSWGKELVEQILLP